MKRAFGSVIVLGLIGGAVCVGLTSAREQDPIDSVRQVGELLAERGYDCDSVETSLPAMVPERGAKVGICRVRDEPATLYVFQSEQDASIHRLRFQKGSDVAWVTGSNWIVALRGPRLAGQIAESLGADVLVDENFLDETVSHEKSELRCPPGDLIQSTEADFPYGAKGFQGEPEDAVTRALEGLRPDDEIEVTQEDFGAWAEVYRDDLKIGIIDLSWTGSGWLAGSSSFCASSRILHG